MNATMEKKDASGAVEVPQDQWPTCQLVQGRQGEEACYSGEFPIKGLLQVTVRRPFDAAVGISSDQSGVNRTIIPGRPPKIAADYEEMLGDGEVPELGCLLAVDERNDAIVHRGGGRYAVKPGSLVVIDAQHRSCALEHALENPEEFPLLCKFIAESTMTTKIIRAVSADTARKKFLGVNTKQRKPSRILIIDMVSCQEDSKLTPKQLNEKIVALALKQLANDPSSCWHGRIDLTGDYNQGVPPSKKITNAGELVRCSQPLVRVLRDRLNVSKTEDLIETVRLCLHHFFEYVRIANEDPFKNYYEYSLQRGCARGLCLVVAALVSYYASGGRKGEFKAMSLEQFWDTVFPQLLTKSGNILAEADFWHRDTGNARQYAGQGWGCEEELAKKVWGFMRPDNFRNRPWDDFLPRAGGW